jgi:uncharacterized protein with HEPN domain
VTKRDRRFLIDDMLQAVDEIAKIAEGIDLATFKSDSMRHSATIRYFEVLGEAASRVPSEIRAQAPDIPWRFMIDMRNRLIHGYFLVDLAIVYKNATKNIPGRREPLEELLASLDDV